MYKGYAHSAIGRGRPGMNDVARVADGIAASLRQFSISARAAEGNEDPQISRAKRSADAFKEASSLTPRGIDARSLAAAKPTKGLTIIRVPVASREGFQGRQDGYVRRGGQSRGGASSRGGGIRGGSIRGGSIRGGSIRGQRGGQRGGLRGGTIRGRGNGVRRGRGPKKPLDKEDLVPKEILTEEEQKIRDGIHMGYEYPWEPRTSLESLGNELPPVISSGLGLKTSIIHKMTSTGSGMMFVDKEQRTDFRKYQGAARLLKEPDRKSIMQHWIAGHYYDEWQPAKEGVLLDQVEAIARRNETYQSDDAVKLKEKLRKLLPAQVNVKSCTGSGTRVEKHV